MKLAVSGWQLAVALLLASCASTPPPPLPPPLTEVPRTVLDTFCAKLHDEGVSAETTLNVVTMTQPLITPNAMSGLAEAAFYQQRFDPVAASAAANEDAAPMPVVVPEGGCAWRGVEETAKRAADVMTIELSSPFRNPFAKNSYGLFARLSLGSEASTWYWVPLGAVNGRWAVGRPILMGLR